MDSRTNVQELKDIVKDFCERRDWDKYHNAKDLSIGISTEAAELLEIFRFKSEDEIREILNSVKKTHIEEELGDVLYFVLRFAQMYNIDLSTTLRNVIEKNERNYPTGKSKGSNKKYTEL